MALPQTVYFVNQLQFAILGVWNKTKLGRKKRVNTNTIEWLTINLFLNCFNLHAY